MITQNEMNILGFTRQHKIAWKSGRKFILKFSPQADFNFVQPWDAVRGADLTQRHKAGLVYLKYCPYLEVYVMSCHPDSLFCCWNHEKNFYRQSLVNSWRVPF